MGNPETNNTEEFEWSIIDNVKVIWDEFFSKLKKEGYNPEPAGKRRGLTLNETFTDSQGRTAEARLYHKEGDKFLLVANFGNPEALAELTAHLKANDINVEVSAEIIP